MSQFTSPCRCWVRGQLSHRDGSCSTWTGGASRPSLLSPSYQEDTKQRINRVQRRGRNPTWGHGEASQREVAQWNLNSAPRLNVPTSLSTQLPEDCLSLDAQDTQVTCWPSPCVPSGPSSSSRNRTAGRYLVANILSRTMLGGVKGAQDRPSAYTQWDLSRKQVGSLSRLKRAKSH